MRRTVVSLSIAGVLAGLALPSIAAPNPPVGVQTDTHNGVAVGTTVNGQPGAGAFVRNGRACLWVSLQVPLCADLPNG